MTEPGLKSSASSLSRASTGRNPDTLARLQALDKNGGKFRNFPNGQLDLDEVCDVVDEIVRKEKTERTLKWLLAALALFSLLTIAATVGLTYAVVALSQDTQVDGSVLQSKDTGEALRTGSFLQSQNATALSSAVAASDDPAAVLGRVTSIKVPSVNEGEAYTVHKVDSVTMMLNGSMIARTATGLDVLLPAAGDGLGLRNVSDRGQTPQGPGRKLSQSYADDHPGPLRAEYYFDWAYLNSLTNKKCGALLTIEQGPSDEGANLRYFDSPDYTRAFYQFFNVPDFYTIADIKSFFSNTTMVENFPHDPSLLQFTTKGDLVDPVILADNVTLLDLGCEVNVRIRLYMVTRPVDVYLRGLLSVGSDIIGTFVPAASTFNDVKREMKAFYGQDIDAATIDVRVTPLSSPFANEDFIYTAMNDGDKISTFCDQHSKVISWGELGWACEMIVVDPPLVQSL